jgi:dienelactone hydrolase
MLTDRRLCLALMLLLTLLLPTLTLRAAAEPGREELALPRAYRGKQITITAELHLPPGTGRVPAMIIQHGSGGVAAAREGRYAREIVKLGVAALVMDSFKGRGIVSTVADQSAVSSQDMAEDAFAAVRRLASHPRIAGDRIGILGFSKGGTVALLTALERRANRALPDGLRLALHVALYPGCGSQYFKPKSTGAPIYLLLGGADTYVGVGPCQEYAAALKAEGAAIDVTVYPGAPHGFDGERSYRLANGENWSRCVFVEQPDGSWTERSSGVVTHDSRGQRIEAGYRRALAACRGYGVSGGPNEAARTKAMLALKGYLHKHLLEGR